MSLIGNLEDLSLPDILQIISLSKKSGILFIHRGQEEGRIYLRQGKVILTYTPAGKRNMGSILMEKKLITREQLDAGLESQKRGGMKELLGTALVNLGFVPLEALEQVIQEQIEDTIFYFLTWQEGTFKFDLKEVDDRLEIGIDPQVFILQKGIDTQWLVLEGTRIIDERKRAEASGKGKSAAPEEGPAAPPSLIVLVDDDDFFSQRFTDLLGQRGLKTERFAGVAEAERFIDEQHGMQDFVVAIDVVMPTSDGRGFLGGLELARRLHADYPGLRFKVITAYPDDSVSEQLEALDAAPLLLKPSIVKGASSEKAMELFIGNLLSSFRMAQVHDPDRIEKGSRSPHVIPAPAPEAHPPAPSAEDLAGTQLQILGEEIAKLVGSIKTEVDSFQAIKPLILDLMEEIKISQSPSELGLIILRLASEIFDRSILFRASEERIVGLGGFGFEARMMENREGIRNLVLELKDTAALRQAVVDLVILRSSDYHIGNNDLLAAIMGTPVPREWIVIPVKGQSVVRLLFYGDRLAAVPLGGETVILQDFLRLVSFYMEQIFWMRKRQQ